MVKHIWSVRRQISFSSIYLPESTLSYFIMAVSGTMTSLMNWLKTVFRKAGHLFSIYLNAITSAHFSTLQLNEQFNCLKRFCEKILRELSFNLTIFQFHSFYAVVCGFLFYPISYKAFATFEIYICSKPLQQKLKDSLDEIWTI